MSIPHLQTQRSLFEPDIQFARLFQCAPAERFRFFGERIMPQLHNLRPRLEAMYCLSNGRPAEEPTRMLAVLILQFMEGLPDRKAVEACNYDLRWKLALGYKTQVAETVPTEKAATKAPTDAVITAIVTQPAITSDHGSISQIEEEWKRQDLDKPAQLYVDGGYTSGEVLAKAAHTPHAAWESASLTAPCSWVNTTSIPRLADAR